MEFIVFGGSTHFSKRPIPGAARYAALNQLSDAILALIFELHDASCLRHLLDGNMASAALSIFSLASSILRIW
jgi:hypothetical protein